MNIILILGSGFWAFLLAGLDDIMAMANFSITYRSKFKYIVMGTSAGLVTLLIFSFIISRFFGAHLPDWVSTFPFISFVLLWLNCKIFLEIFPDFKIPFLLQFSKWVNKIIHFIFTPVTFIINFLNTTIKKVFQIKDEEVDIENTTSKSVFKTAMITFIICGGDNLSLYIPYFLMKSPDAIQNLVFYFLGNVIALGIVAFGTSHYGKKLVNLPEDKQNQFKIIMMLFATAVAVFYATKWYVYTFLN